MRFIVICWLINNAHGSASSTAYLFYLIYIADAKGALCPDCKRAAKRPHRRPNFLQSITVKVFKPIDGKSVFIWSQFESLSQKSQDIVIFISEKFAPWD